MDSQTDTMSLDPEYILDHKTRHTTSLDTLLQNKVYE